MSSIETNLTTEHQPASDEAESGSRAGFARFAWWVLAYTLAVILFGAWVRITGSGAGCGEHWPTCHGEVIPRAPSTSTMIEYTHRVTSGLLGPMALALCVWAYLLPGRRWWLRNAAVLSLVFIIFEGLIGAGLVLGELVANDASVARAVVIALHLGNTLILTAALAVTAWLGGQSARRYFDFRSKRVRPLLCAAAAVVAVSMSGAVTALGDTLFPVAVSEGAGWFGHLRNDLAPGAHFLVQLRVIHPVLAIGVGIILAWYCQKLAERGGEGAKFAGWCAALTWLQLALGAVNIALRAPGAMQLLHLLAAQILWMCLVLLIFSRAAKSSPRAPQSHLGVRLG